MRTPRIRVDTFFPAQSKAVTSMRRLLKRVADDDSADEYDRLPVVVLMAFSVEGYLNRLGSKHFKDWDDLERKPWRWKLNKLLNSASGDDCWATRQLTFAVELFQIRDRLAHGKPYRVEGPILGGWDAVNKYTKEGKTEQPDWYKALTREWIVEAETRFVDLMGFLAARLGHEPDDYLHTSSTYAVPC